MEENGVATESPMQNGDGHEQSPVEEKAMSTTVLKGDDARINWPAGDGDAGKHYIQVGSFCES